ncbi:putative polyketide synthase [Nemania sp. FL0916]|nr:putative polyketide synthase [Nemania sp. FL0916]
MRIKTTDSELEMLHDTPMPPVTEGERRRYIQEPVAIVGMGCRLPGHSNSPSKLWELLERGGIADNHPPESRFRMGTHYDSSKKPHTMRSPGGMFLETVDPKKFDAAFFGISKTEAIAMDPQQRQLLEVVYECLENAGIPLDHLNGEKIGCFIGSYAVDYGDMQARDPDDRVPSVTIGIGRAILSNRISHFLNIHGPSMTIDTACSGSLVGLDVACGYLSSGEIDGALVGGANLYLSPEHVMDIGPMKGASSLSGRCHTFDKKADGYIKAEGVNCVMLKRLCDAERDGDPIRAIIRGTATNSDGRTPGIASPSSEAQAMVIRSAYSRGGITDLSATAYIEMHGTGTQAGDPEEVKGVASVFSPSRSQSAPLIIGSIKSNIGHSEPAAGISGLIKAVLSVEKGRIPGNPTFIDPNPAIDFEGMRVRATRWTIPWPHQSGLRRASVNSFGYGGSNAHCIIEEVPREKQGFVSCFSDTVNDDLFADESGVSRPHVLVLSANDESSAKACTELFRRHLLNPKVSVQMDSLAYTLSERRSRHFYRGYTVTKTPSLDPSAFVYGKTKGKTPRIGFIFTGQGAQWPRMGRALLQNFPLALETIKRLDIILQGLIHPPKWSLVQELTEARDPQVLRQPEFSQPLVTALQIALVHVLRSWGVKAKCVVGHSSGEIAAAYAAGLLTEENAIKSAYYRGYGVQATQGSQPCKMGMMAVGLSSKDAQAYILEAARSRPGVEAVTVACDNSPNSVTLSGPVSLLEVVQAKVTADKQFARMLQVDMAYHSPFMEEIGETYVKYLDAEAISPIKNKTSEVKMFSSVDGRWSQRAVDVGYWYSNMIQPVRFRQALEQMLTDEDAPDFLIEVGPSGALAGPVGQIKKSMPGGGSNVQYCSAMARGQDAENAPFDVAGKLFVAGYPVDLMAVNSIPANPAPKVLVDLSNYSWNHDKEYWYENEASRDWRNRQFPHHDLLGSKVLGTPWRAPVWKKSLVVEDLPWLKDHRLGADIVFPGAGYMCMAVEAMIQIDAALRVQSRDDGHSKQQVRLRNVTFDRALVLDKDRATRIMTTMAPFATQKGGWYFWVVRSLVEDSWVDHCSGQARMEKDARLVGSPSAMAGLEHPTPGAVWYKSMSDVGYNFGKEFRKLQLTETISGSRNCRSQIGLRLPQSSFPQSHYPMHPAVLDGCMQSCAPGLWSGINSNVDSVLVPAVIDDIVFRSTYGGGDKGISISHSAFAGPGRGEETKNYVSHAKIYDSESGELLLRITGLRYHKLDVQGPTSSGHNFSRLVWEPDVTLSPQADKKCQNDWEMVQHVLDLVAFKKPNAAVAEVMMVPDETSSAWLEEINSTSKPRNSYGSHRLFIRDSADFVVAQGKYSAMPRVSVELLTPKSFSRPESRDSQQERYDLIVLRAPRYPDEIFRGMLDSAINALENDGHLLVLQQNRAWRSDSEGHYQNGQHINGHSPSMDTILEQIGFQVVRKLTCSGSEWLSSGYLAMQSAEEPATTRVLDIVQFGAPGKICDGISRELREAGWDIREVMALSHLGQIRNEATILVISELEIPLLPTLTPDQWTALQEIFQRRNRILWVSKSSQWKVSNPEGAMIHGLCRSIRREDPLMKITTLDINSNTPVSAATSIDAILRSLQQVSGTRGSENEYVEREGVFYVSRILGDDEINTMETSKSAGVQPGDMRLHEAPTTVRMISERVGSVDSLHFVEIDSTELSLPDNKVGVELFASALNFKDVAVAMGIVPENHHLLGLEGAGTIRRVGANLRSPFHIGERVLVFEKGTFANRIIAATERTISIPAWLSFEDAATLPSVYLTALYSLFDLASIKKGDRVLIHSATGGLGIAAIHICHSVGAEVYATVGQDVKKQFLLDTFGIASDHVFSSRNPDFEAGIMEHTQGYGVDIILNSLTGDLLDASWRCIAEGGTMVELGKKDHIDRNVLSMEPFARNASYRCFDMSHKHVTDEVIAILLRRTIDLIKLGGIKPISPIRLFPYSEIPSALRFMRGANHIGKIVISNREHTEADPTVPVRPALRGLKLRSDVSYLIVGGLKGLCGSLALDMARHGARSLVIMSRSGACDSRSQRVLKDLRAHECHTDLIQGDVVNIEDVRRAFKSSVLPVAGVVHGAMVLRDKPFEFMSHDDYHQTTSCKVAGTWNLHNVSTELGLSLDFFTMLSSISGLIGQPAQANYAAANAFLDSFAYYRRGQGLNANSINLGAIDDVGYMAEHSELIEDLDTSAWVRINESLLHRIVQYSIMQQEYEPINKQSCAQLITSISIPQSPTSSLLSDARFSSLLLGTTATGAATGAGSDSTNSSNEIRALRNMIADGADVPAAVPVAVEVMNRQFMLTLRLEEPLEPEKPLSAYGLDSLAAIEFRNWCRVQLGAELTTLEITGGPSLLSLAEKAVTKLQATLRQANGTTVTSSS